MKLKILVVLFLVVFLAACTGQKNTVTAIDSGSHDAGQHHLHQQYTCPMHPKVVKDEPGSCPVCGMDLVPVKENLGKSNSIKFTDAQLKLANITLMKAGTGSLASKKIINGRIAADPEQSEVVSLKIGGRIDKLFIKETGTSVKKGEALFQLFSEELLTLQQEYLLAWAQLREFGRENPRYVSFFQSAEKKLLLFGMSKKQLAHIRKAGKTTPQVTFFAPQAGIVNEIRATEGQYLPEGAAVYAFEKLDRVWVEGELYPGEASEIKIGEKIGLLIPGFENQLLNATVSFINPEYEPTTQLTLFRAVLPNPSGMLKPRMPVQIKLNRNSSLKLTVPLTAIVRSQKGTQVYVKTGQNTFEPRTVQTGTESSEAVEIVSGLNEGDAIAATGAYLIYSEFVLKKGADPMSGMGMLQ